ncbi:Protein CBG00406 [Caenorhabditis briggsae]|uniref:protein-disulfide reductase n=2 Tax=Caenorhabditis briggsae TaxID=6238 RepID=A0AAE9ABV3_CAEBR|nr:Protein CBG00406 [Caenorhabditis briggsae]ULT92974.1 hypothetical protein L3Y34_002865 [Caenorhabditis briggsae]UMM26229.1 hypothetical protein L5515_010024 [Caenorhabditis briggsae]CAP21861.1 Protein CBG00406 [Caenorhabditis briggsae]
MSPPLLTGSGASLLRGCFSSFSAIRNAHFLASVPMKKRGVEGTLPKDYFDNKTVVVYFSAGWCGSCKFLTPKLKKFYNAVKESEAGKNLEIVWVSQDKEEAHLEEYYEKNLPDWPYIPFGDENMKKLAEKCKAAVIPVLKLVDSDGNVVHDRVRADVEAGIKADPVKTMEEWKKLLKQ